MVKKGENCNLKQQLGLIIDEQGILRCKGRYQNSELTQGAKCPKLLPPKEYFTKLNVEEVHSNMFHSGVSQTLAEIRQEYWILKGRSVVKRVLNGCKVCQMVEGGPYRMPQIPSWPKERVVQSVPFEYSGLDYFGPLYIKNYVNVASEDEAPATKKVWVCLFTCFAIRAVHIELIEDMSAEEFLLCFRRFIARRDIPKQILSDNAKQFKTARSVLNKIWSDVVRSDDVIDFSAAKELSGNLLVI